MPLYSPNIESITVVKKGKVRRAKLYYLRDRVGKAAKIKELIVKKETSKKKPAAKKVVKKEEPVKEVEENIEKESK